MGSELSVHGARRARPSNRAQLVGLRPGHRAARGRASGSAAAFEGGSARGQAGREEGARRRSEEGVADSACASCAGAGSRPHGTCAYHGSDVLLLCAGSFRGRPDAGSAAGNDVLKGRRLLLRAAACGAGGNPAADVFSAGPQAGRDPGTLRAGAGSQASHQSLPAQLQHLVERKRWRLQLRRLPPLDTKYGLRSPGVRTAIHRHRLFRSVDRHTSQLLDNQPFFLKTPQSCGVGPRATRGLFIFNFCLEN